MARILVVGLGNPILGDDGVGWRVAEAVQCRVTSAGVEVDCCALGGLSLMERMVGYDRAIVIDALTLAQPPGTVTRFRLEALPEACGGHSGAAHDTSLQTALRLGRALGAHLPEDVVVIGVAADRVYDFDEALTPAVAAAVPEAARAVLQIIDREEPRP
jgi:hydrogenase maturation protease